MNDLALVGELLEGTVVTEPGTPAARAHGCTCPVQEPVRTESGGVRYLRDPGCSLHRLFAVREVER